MKKLLSVISLFASFMLYAVSEEASGEILKLSELIAGKNSVYIKCSVLLDKDINLPPTADLTFQDNGRIIADAAKKFKLTINGPMKAPNAVQIFEGFAPGQVTILSNSIIAVYPQWWGAKANGKNDDSAAIQCAVDCGRREIYLPEGDYLLNSAIDITNKRGGINLKGAGMDAGTVLLGNTGGTVLDTSGSATMLLENFKIIGGNSKAITEGSDKIEKNSNPSTIGILFGRSNIGKYAEFSSINNVTVQLPSIAAANNGNGTVAIYNCAAEMWRAYNINLLADNGIVFTGNNIFKVQSDFTNLGAYSSMSCVTIDGASCLKGFIGPCVILENAFRIDILNAYFAGGRGKNAFPYAVALKKRGQFQESIKITGHSERPEAGFLYNEINVTDLDIEITSALFDHPTVLNRGTIIGGNLSMKTWQGTPNKDSVLLESTGDVQNLNINLGTKQSIHASKALFTGNMIKTNAKKADAIAQIITNKKTSSYLLISKDGIEIKNPEKE